jgi:hypothetical protein
LANQQNVAPPQDPANNAFTTLSPSYIRQQISLSAAPITLQLGLKTKPEKPAKYN